jgi:E3 ubiquitin-protein ligase RHF
MQFPVGANDAELEERMIQHLAAAAAMGRRHFARREGQRNRSSAQGRLLKVVCSRLSAILSILKSTQRILLVQFLLLQLREKVNLFLQSQERATPSCPTLESSPQPITPLSSEALVDPSSASASGFSVSNQHGNSMENWCSNRSIVTVFFLTSGYFHNYR